MAQIVNCWVCGKPHEYCSHCGETHGWKYVADTREHYQIYMLIEEYRSGIFSKEQAIKLFAEYGVKAEDDLSWLLPNVEKGIREIIGQRKAKEKVTSKTK